MGNDSLSFMDTVPKNAHRFEAGGLHVPKAHHYLKVSI